MFLSCVRVVATDMRFNVMTTECYVFRCDVPFETETNDFTYEDLLNTAKTLSEIHNSVRKSLMEEIETKSKKYDYNVWKQVLRDLKSS